MADELPREWLGEWLAARSQSISSASVRSPATIWRAGRRGEAAAHLWCRRCSVASSGRWWPGRSGVRPPRRARWGGDSRIVRGRGRRARVRWGAAEVFDVSGSDSPEPGAGQLAVVIDVGQRAEACGVEASAQLLGCLCGHGAHGWRAPGGRRGPHTRRADRRFAGVRTRWTGGDGQKRSSGMVLRSMP